MWCLKKIILPASTAPVEISLFLNSNILLFSTLAYTLKMEGFQILKIQFNQICSFFVTI